MQTMVRITRCKFTICIRVVYIFKLFLREASLGSLKVHLYYGEKRYKLVNRIKIELKNPKHDSRRCVNTAKYSDLLHSSRDVCTSID